MSANPANNQLAFRVYQREYGNALVLYKPLAYSAGQGVGGTGAAAVTTHNLNGNYRILNANGTSGPLVASVSLKHGEEATLVKA